MIKFSFEGQDYVLNMKKLIKQGLMTVAGLDKPVKQLLNESLDTSPKNIYHVGEVFRIDNDYFMLTRNVKGLFLVDLYTGFWWIDPIKTANVVYATAAEFKLIIGEHTINKVVPIECLIDYSDGDELPVYEDNRMYFGSYFKHTVENVFCVLIYDGMNVSLMDIATGQIRYCIKCNIRNNLYISMQSWYKLTQYTSGFKLIGRPLKFTDVK